MKKINYFFAVLFALLCVSNAARADIVQNYLMDFNTKIDVSSKHDFRVGSGWGHIVDTFGGDYCSYFYSATSGIDGSGALSCDDQTAVGGSYWDPDDEGGEVYDLLVTPKVTGNVSFYVKSNGYGGTVQVYNVTKDGTKYTRGSLVTLPSVSITTTKWTKIELPVQTDAYLGIRLVKCYIDNFAADQAEVEYSKSLSVDKVVANVKGDPACNTEGKFKLDFTVTITNNGDLDLKAADNDPNYSLSVVNYSNANAVCFTVPVTEDLAKGASTTVQLTGFVDYDTYPSYNRYDVMENFGQSTKYGAWYTPVPYKPILAMRSGSSNMDAGTTVKWGKINQPVSKSFTIRNTGGASLMNATVAVPEGFECSIKEPFELKAQSDSVFTVSMPATVAGDYSGEVVVSGTGVEPFKFNVEGSVLDPTKFYANFENNKLPVGCVVENAQWELAQIDYTSGENVYALASKSQSRYDKFITPLLKVVDGSTLKFDVGRVNRYTSGAGIYLNIYYSSDRENWTLCDSIPSADLSGDRFSSKGSYGLTKEYTLDKVPAGNWYIGFGAGYTYIDNLYGYEKIDVAHDWLLAANSMPATATVNHAYTAGVTLRNLSSNDEAAGSYTASLYFGDKVVATAEAIELKAGADAAFAFSFVPHEALSAKAYVEFKNTADNYTVKTAEIDLTVAQETAMREVQVGAVTGTGYNSKDTRYVPIRWYDANVSGTASDVLYGPAMLTKYGVPVGGKIRSITFRGTTTSNKTLENVYLTAKVEAMDSLTFTPGEVSETAQVIKIYDNYPALEFTDKSEVETVVQLPEPIVWDGTNSVRVYTEVKANTWISVSYPVDADYSSAWSKTVSNFSSTYVPIGYFNIEIDPTVLSGTVKYGDEAIANATVTLRSEDDIVYSGTTDETGAYSFPVIQTSPVYTLTVSADGYNLYTEENVSMTSSLEKNIQMQKSVVSVTGKVSYRSAGVAGASVSLTSGETVLTSSTGETGEYTVENVVPGLSYTLKVTADRFNDYESAEAILIADAMTLDEVVLTRKAVEVSGKVIYRNAGLQGATVTLSRSGFEQSATTGEDGTYRLEGIVPDYSYAVKVTADKFIGYESAEPVAVDDALVLGDIRLTKPNYKVTGQVKWGNTPVEGVLVQYTGSDNWKLGVYTDAEGKYTLENLNPEMHYLFRVIDLNKEFENITEADSIFADEDFEKNFSVTALPVEISIPASCYATYSYKRALDLGAATGLKAYVVTEVKKNYIVVSEVSEIPAGTGVLLQAADGKYEATAVESAAAPGVNMLVGVTGDDFTIGSENVGKAWALTDDGGLSVFKSVAGTTVAKGTAYLACESSEPVIYLNAADGIRSIDGAASIGVLDESKPMYNLAGQKVGKEYRGVVIQNGKKFNR